MFKDQTFGLIILQKCKQTSCSRRIDPGQSRSIPTRQTCRLTWPVCGSPVQRKEVSDSSDRQNSEEFLGNSAAKTDTRIARKTLRVKTTIHSLPLGCSISVALLCLSSTPHPHHLPLSHFCHIISSWLALHWGLSDCIWRWQSDRRTDGC